MPWSKFSGGRSNSVWKVKSDDGLVCVKLYQENWNNPLYSNNSLDELVCLTALHDKRICPQPIAHVKTAYGDCLIYDHVTGKTTTDEVEKVALHLPCCINMIPLPHCLVSLQRRMRSFNTRILFCRPVAMILEMS